RGIGWGSRRGSNYRVGILLIQSNKLTRSDFFCGGLQSVMSLPDNKTTAANDTAQNQKFDEQVLHEGNPFPARCCRRSRLLKSQNRILRRSSQPDVRFRA